MTRYWLMLALFVVAAAIPAMLTRADAAPALAVDEDVPAAVRTAAAQGRFWRASRILGNYLATVPDTTPETILLASRLSAGWGDWVTVVELLEGRPWLDEVGGGTGWRLLGLSQIRLGQLERGSAALDRHVELAGPGSPDRGLDHLRRGLALGAAGQTLTALVAFDHAAEQIPWFADWANFFAAEAAAATADTAEVRRRLEASEPGLAASRGWRFRVDAARRAGDLSQARRVALDAARDATPVASRAAAWTLLGDLRVEGGDTGRAREAYRSAMEAAPGTTAAVDAARGLRRLGPTPDEWRMVGSVYLRHGNRDRAIEGFEAYLASGAGTHADRARARLQLGQALFDAGRFADAERRMLALAADSVPARVAADALHLAGRAQYRQGRTSDGQRTFARVAERFPDQDGATRALYMLADLQHDDGDLESARRNFRRAASASPTLNEAGLSLMRLGGIEYLKENYESAAAVFEEYRAMHPDGRRIGQATYWAARSYQAVGRDAEARALLRRLRAMEPLSYYGIRAGQILGEPALAIRMEPEPARIERTDSLVRIALRRVDLLAELDRRGELVHEVERLRAHFARVDGGDYALAEALNERGYTLTGISMGWDIQRREGAWNPRLLRVIYPFPFRELVVSEALERAVDPFLVAAVIRRESAFNPTVTSSAGAIGLMQIMPQTGRGLAQGAGIPRFHLELLRQPELNVHLGVRYLAQLLGQYDGAMHLVLSAYNAGPGRANRWRQMPEIRDAELFAERIPFSETRDYVRHVLLNLALYRELYPDAARAQDARPASPTRLADED